MNYSEIKAVKTFADDLFSTPCYREIIEKVQAREDDFKIGGVRFINSAEIDEIQAKELTNDLYCLGCFNANFIARQCNWPVELVTAAQEGDAFEALGKAIKDNTDMVEFAQAYSGADGYGHHFNSYNHGEQEITIDGVDYYVFDQH